MFKGFFSGFWPYRHEGSVKLNPGVCLKIRCCFHSGPHRTDLLNTCMPFSRSSRSCQLVPRTPASRGMGHTTSMQRPRRGGATQHSYELWSTSPN